jgi:hypothetical protein
LGEKATTTTMMGDARRPPREPRSPLIDYKWTRSLSERVRGMKDGPLGKSWRGRRDKKLQGKVYSNHGYMQRMHAFLCWAVHLTSRRYQAMYERNKKYVPTHALPFY